MILRIIIAPQHINQNLRRKTGEIKLVPAALADAERHGLSMFRDGVGDDLIKKIATDLVTRARGRDPRAGVFGVFRLECGIIRASKIDGEQPGYCVYDTAEPANSFHVESFQRIFAVPEEIRLKRRRELFDYAQRMFIPVGAFRYGLLRDLAPPS